MLATIFSRAFSRLMKKPMRLWGISLLNTFVLAPAAAILFAVPLGLSLALTTLLSVGMTMVYLHGYRGEKVEVRQLFEPFKSFKTAFHVLGGELWGAMWIVLFALIPIAGIVIAIVKACQYALSSYILMLEPEVRATDAIKVSKERTKGYLGTIFLANILPELVVFGCSGLFMLLGGALHKVPLLGSLITFIGSLILILGSLILPLYKGMIQSAIYEEINENEAHRPGAADTASAAEQGIQPEVQVYENGVLVSGNEARYCPVCGEKVEDDANFCPKCGAKL